VQQIEPVLLVYAIALNGIPLVRKLFISFRNARIEARNARRKRWAASLKSDPGVSDRVQEAARYATVLKSAKDMDMVFSSDMEMDDVLKDKDFDDFDSRLSGSVKPAGKGSLA